MIKYAVILATVAVMAHAQRPPYAGSANRHYPQVLPQYLPASVNEVDATTGIVQRVGVEAAPGASAPEPQTYKPYDPYNDQVLLDTIKTWPREKQPFWYINSQQIQEHLGGSPSTPQRIPAGTRSTGDMLRSSAGSTTGPVAYARRQ